MKVEKNLKNQINYYIDEGAGIVDVINFLFTCDYEAWQIAQMLIVAFDYEESFVRNVFKECFDIEFDCFISIADFTR